ncbi:hypothetical protein ASE01_16995 [Nocardioides sp. Root190]|uniref:Mov34/MPN/PAD-1 family protein n=1 Tax=Nocardioides sp. Root190 TaxID=1736488 RepID=UPI0006F1E034|nr:Mov34/MPN/PAD-1 family protein [Nocardioides sp. Root190]KRB75062.1 hypothetical protein ASE01_16995 [Nocardioides sp. Root190]
MTDDEVRPIDGGTDRDIATTAGNDAFTDETSGEAEPFRVEITLKSFDAIGEEVRLGGPILETGGILLGHESRAGCRITLAGGPGPAATREPLAFSRDLAHAETLADQAWNHDRAIWLGEWHTHPYSPPTPSETDMAAYARHLADPDLGFDTFISIIVGRMTDLGQDEAALALVWVVDRRGARTTPLLLVEETP